MKRIKKQKGITILQKELKRCYSFFRQEGNFQKGSKGYGLIRDKSRIVPNVASIASVGYGLAALLVGIKHGWIKQEKAYYIANQTLHTFLEQVEGKEGFFYHFVDIHTAKRVWDCEISIIDTAIFLCGALTIGEALGGEVKEKAQRLYKKVNWNWYLNKKTNQFYMGYVPEKGFFGAWDCYAEQLMLYILAVGSPTFPVNSKVYESFEKPIGSYGKLENIIYTYCGTLFTYQFSHAWIDFRNLIDPNGIDWFENSIKATKANRQYCIEHQKSFRTFGENSWGLTACIGPKGYCGGYGAKPCKAKLEIENDGTVAPCGSIGSIVFTPKEVLDVMEQLYNNDFKLWSRYGFRDGYNLEKQKPWYAKEYIGIDKGISLVMIENYLSGEIWKHFMKNSYVQRGLEKIGFRKKEEKVTLTKQ